MKAFCISLKYFAAVVCCLVFLIPPVQAQKASPKVEKELIELQNQWAEARIKGDIAFLEKLYAKEFRITALDGNAVTRDADIGVFASKVMKPEIIKDEDMQVSVYGTTAIVTGIEHMKGTYRNNPGEFWIRFTNIYVRRGNRWQMFASIN